MEGLPVNHENQAILDRNLRYLENIMEERPIPVSFIDRKRLEKCIWSATGDVFDSEREWLQDGYKVPEDVRARRGAALVFRTLTFYSNSDIAYELGIEPSTVDQYIKRSRSLMRSDIFFSAFVLTATIKAYGKFYPAAGNPANTAEIIELAQRIDRPLPVLRAA